MAMAQAPTTQRTPTSAVISSDARLVAAQAGNRIQVWDRRTGKVKRALKADPLFRGAVSSRALVAVGEKGITVWQGPGYARKVSLDTPAVLAMGKAAISANGKVAAAFYAKDGGAGDPDRVGVWDARSGKMRMHLTLKRGRVQGAALSSDGRLLALCADAPQDGAILKVYRLHRRRAAVQINWSNKADQTTFSAAFSPGGRLLALGAGKRILLWDIKKRKIIATAPTADIKALFPAPLRGPAVSMPGAHLLAFSADGRRLASLHGFGVVGVSTWRVSPLAPEAWIKRPRHGGTMRGLAWDQQNHLWLISSTYSPKVWVHGRRGDRFTTAKVLAFPAPPKSASGP